LGCSEVLVKMGADIEHVPIVDQDVRVAQAYDTIDDLLEFAEGPSLNPQTKREGLVFKSWESNFTFKAIANSYLLSKGIDTFTITMTDS